MNHSLCSTLPSVLKATVPPPQYRRTLSLFHCGTGIVGAGNGSGCTAVPSEPRPVQLIVIHIFSQSQLQKKTLHFTAYMNVERVLSLSHLPLLPQLLLQGGEDALLEQFALVTAQKGLHVAGLPACPGTLHEFVRST